MTLNEAGTYSSTPVTSPPSPRMTPPQSAEVRDGLGPVPHAADVPALAPLPVRPLAPGLGNNEPVSRDMSRHAKTANATITKTYLQSHPYRPNKPTDPGRWLDQVIMQRALGPGDAMAPPA